MGNDAVSLLERLQPRKVSICSATAMIGWSLLMNRSSSPAASPEASDSAAVSGATGCHRLSVL